MTEDNAYTDAEKWVRDVGLPKLFKQKFRRDSILLKSGGQYGFDTVSEDGNIVAVISARPGKTPDGKPAAENLKKIRSDVYWMLMIDQKPEKMLLVLTDRPMISLIKEEKKKGRFPKEIEIVGVKLPGNPG